MAVSVDNSCQLHYYYRCLVSILKQLCKPVFFSSLMCTPESAATPDAGSQEAMSSKILLPE